VRDGLSVGNPTAINCGEQHQGIVCFETFLQMYCRKLLKAKLDHLHTAPGRRFGEERLFVKSCGVAYCRCILSWESFEKKSLNFSVDTLKVCLMGFWLLTTHP
jgi:hypothetical protein